MDDIIKIVESLEKSDLLIDDGATETVRKQKKQQQKTKQKNKKNQEDGFLEAVMAPAAAGCFSDSNCGFFIDRTRRQISSIISFTFNDKNYVWKRSYKGWKRSQKDWKRI